MKIIISILFSALLGAVVLGGPVEGTKNNSVEKLSANFEKAEPCTLSAGIHFIGKLGKKPECSKLGLSCLKLKPFVEVNKFNPGSYVEGETTLYFEYISNTLIKVTFNLNRDETVFEIEEPFLLPDLVSKKFKLSSIEILPGNYSIAKNRNGSFTVQFNISSK
ncbi:MAG: hypothetical protein WED33_03950 [Bacteroidia bacterium]